jgi:alpha-beta hydrolase superfamily lysophospholipase
VCTCGFYTDLTNGLKIIGRQRCYDSTPNPLPLLFYSGKDDPVGNFGKGVERVASSYRKSGNQDVTVVLKDKMRHECLNELDRDDCYKDIFSWIDSQLKS